MGYIKRTPEDCSGCLACELSCSVAHYGYFDFNKSRIAIIHDEKHSIIEIHQCQQCDEKSCVHACPVEALSIDAQIGNIVLDKDLCIGCRACQKACNYQAVLWDFEESHPLICDLCGGDPECLKPCRLHKALLLEKEEAVV